MTDALESFRLSSGAIEPRAAFARDLRARVERAARTERGEQMTTTPTSGTTLTPYLAVRGASAAIDFYVRAFGATERHRLTGPDGRIGHAEIEIAGNTVMLADEYPEHGAKGPETLGGSAVLLHLNVPDVDAFVARAVDAGATLVRPIENQFYGDRSGTMLDPFGHTWMVNTTVENVDPEEMNRRWAAIEDERSP